MKVPLAPPWLSQIVMCGMPAFTTFRKKFAAQKSLSWSLVSADATSLDVVMASEVSKRLWLLALRTLLQREARACPLDCCCVCPVYPHATAIPFFVQRLTSHPKPQQAQASEPSVAPVLSMPRKENKQPRKGRPRIARTPPQTRVFLMPPPQHQRDKQVLPTSRSSLL